jgi:hypothetical protein
LAGGNGKFLESKARVGMKGSMNWSEYFEMVLAIETELLAIFKYQFHQCNTFNIAKLLSQQQNSNLFNSSSIQNSSAIHCNFSFPTKLKSF